MSYPPNLPQPPGGGYDSGYGYHYGAPPPPAGPGGFQMPSVPNTSTPSFPSHPSSYQTSTHGSNQHYYTPPAHDGYAPSYAPPPPSYLPPASTSYIPTYASNPPSGPPPPSTYTYPQQNQFAPPPGLPPQQYGNNYQGAGVGANVIYYLNTAIPTPFGGPGSAPVVPGYDGNADFEKVRKATKGSGTDENMLISTLVPLSAMKLAVLSVTFRAGTGKRMVEVIDSETSGYFRDVLHGLALGPLWYDVELVNEALRGAGTDELLLTELLVDRSPSDIYNLSVAFRQRYGRGLEESVGGDLSGKTERLFTMILSSNRPQDTAPVDGAQVEVDVKELYRAAQGKIGTDEIAFCNVVVNRSRTHLAALWDAYRRQHGKTLARVVKSEFSGHMKHALLYIVNGINPKRINEGGPGVWRDAKMIEAAMKGIGTNDKQLVRRLVRLHWDHQRFQSIKVAYEKKYRKALEKRVAGETSGDYKKVAVALVVC